MFSQASLTVWWIILRFMGDLPEPKKHAQVGRPTTQERFMPQELISRKDRRLSNMVGLDQVTTSLGIGVYFFGVLPKVLTLKKI